MCILQTWIVISDFVNVMNRKYAKMRIMQDKFCITQLGGKIAERKSYVQTPTSPWNRPWIFDPCPRRWSPAPGSDHRTGAGRTAPATLVTNFCTPPCSCTFRSLTCKIQHWCVNVKFCRSVVYTHTGECIFYVILGRAFIHWWARFAGHVPEGRKQNRFIDAWNEHHKIL